MKNMIQYFTTHFRIETSNKFINRKQGCRIWQVTA